MGYFLTETTLFIFNLILLTSFIADGIEAIEDKDFWNEIARSELKAALDYKWNTNKAKNVIVFIGDGMSFETITASRIYSQSEEGYLAWEKFPHVGLLKTYDIDKQVPDSASTATALFCGVKTNYGVSGVDANVPRGNCEASLNPQHHVNSILNWAQGVGKDTGFVTTTRVTHATPSALYAHTADRSWECEDNMPETASGCKDIARQLIEDEPGRNIKVILGGGRQMFQSDAVARENDPLDTWSCYSRDGRDLMADWANDKTSQNVSHAVVQNNEELFNVNPDETDYLLGVFGNGHLSMDWNRNTGPQGQPSIENMTTTAIKILQKSEEGFFLVVEGGLIDFAHHRGHAAQALRETVRFSEAISATLELVDTNETLIIVTSDHGHSLTFQGLSERGSDILGIAQNSAFDGTPYTTLGYATGGPNNIGYEAYNATTARRQDPSSEDTTAFTYSQQAAVITDEAKHSGTDVAVYAIGPWAHLFHTTHEQNFVSWVAVHAGNVNVTDNVIDDNDDDDNGNHGSNLKPYFICLLISILPFLR